MPTTRKRTLVSHIVEDLRSELAARSYEANSRLPTEAELSRHFEVSRPTVRAALRELEGLGLVHTRHGVGTFAVEQPTVRAGLERMESITDSIRATGREPGMIYASRLIRIVLPDEAAYMGVPGDTEVLEIRRTVLADDEVVAYSYDLMPIHILPPGFSIKELEGSIFAFLRKCLGIIPDHALAEIHAVTSNHVGWGVEAARHSLFTLLNQLHYDASEQLLLYSRSYFIEGRYTFTIMRRR